MTAKPLTGLRVLDCSLDSAGQQAAGLLADYGAEVIWVEPPGGAPSRRVQPIAASVFNRGKRSVILDVERLEGRDKLLQLADRADVVIESWLPGKAAELGLDFETFHARNPQLVYCSISGFGQDGPYCSFPAYEPLVHALIGTMAVQAGHRDAPIFQALPFAATGAAQLAAIGIMAALYRRLDDGVGRRVETSLFDGALAFHSMTWGESDAALAKGQKHISGRDLAKPTNIRLITRSFVCGDGEYIGIHTGAVGAFDRLMAVLGLQDRIPPANSGFEMGTPLTPEQAELLERKIHGIFAAQPRAYWVKRLLEADVCAVEHFPPTIAFDEPQIRHNRMVVRVADPVLGDIEQVAPAIRFDGAAPEITSAAPAPGQDTAAVLETLGKPAPATPWREFSGGPSSDERPLLDGVRILDLGAYYAGPFSSRLLADLGAEVIKVEPTAGDPLRGIERCFFSAQAGKRSLAANLKDVGLQPAVAKLIAWADVVHHNMRPGAAERLGLGLDQVRTVNPDVIYLYAPGWGSSGPHMLRQSFAPMLSGYVGASYEVAGQYNEPLPSCGNEDPGNGLLGALAMLLALCHRRMTRHALFCENPQINAAAGLLAHIVRRVDGGEALGAGELDVLQTGTAALESLYATRDGWLCLVAREDQEIRALEKALELDILGDERFSSSDLRRANRDALTDLLRDEFERRSTAEWLSTLAAAGVHAIEPAAESCVHALMNDPEHRRTGRIAEASHLEVIKVREIAKLIRISGATIPPHRPAPRLGEHTDDILGWLGYAPGDVEDLRTRGAIR